MNRWFSCFSLSNSHQARRSQSLVTLEVARQFKIVFTHFPRFKTRSFLSFHPMEPFDLTGQWCATVNNIDTVLEETYHSAFLLYRLQQPWPGAAAESHHGLLWALPVHSGQRGWKGELCGSSDGTVWVSWGFPDQCEYPRIALCSVSWRCLSFRMEIKLSAMGMPASILPLS